jgi:uncharacterized protein YceH (UPF0502 family)
MESLEVVKQMLDALKARSEPLVSDVPPAPGSRAGRFRQLLCPDFHPVDAPATPPLRATSASTPSSSLVERVDRLEAEVASLRETVKSLEDALGGPDGTQPP